MTGASRAVFFLSFSQLTMGAGESQFRHLIVEHTGKDGEKYWSGKPLVDCPGVIPGFIPEFPNNSIPRHTIFGAGNPLSKEFRKALAEMDSTAKCRFVNSQYIPKQLFESDETYLIKYDDEMAIDYVVNMSCVVYIFNDFPYSTEVWKVCWPAFLQKVIQACIKHGSKLVLMDSELVYADSEIPNMTELSTIAPSSEKGKVRKELCGMIMNEVRKYIGNTKAIKHKFPRYSDSQFCHFRFRKGL